MTEGRDILKAENEEEKKKWLTKTGTDWSGAFGENPKDYVDSNGKNCREPGASEPLHDPDNPSLEDDSDDDTSDSSDADLGIKDAENTNNGTRGNASLDGATASTIDTTTSSGSASTGKAGDKQNKRTEQRKHRGLMQWKPARNAKFTIDEGKIGLKKLKSKVTGGLDGRQPGVETGTFSLHLQSGFYISVPFLSRNRAVLLFLSFSSRH